MPISSGALEWPASYYRRPEEAEKDRGPGSGDWTPGRSPRGTAQPDYQWQPQLTDRENYEKWRKTMDRKDPLRVKKRKRGTGCCGCLGFQRVSSEQEPTVKDGNRDNVRDVIRRKRRQRCCLLGLCLSLVFLLLLAAVIFVFLYFTGVEELGPAELMECGGQWGKHYLAYREQFSNGTTSYTCCYMPDINDNSTVWRALTMQPAWPDGFIVDKAKCGSPVHASMKCEDYQKDFYQKGIPWYPCSARVTCRSDVILVAAGVILSFAGLLR